MRPEFDTQRKVEAYFAGKTDEDSIWIRDGLYALISDVLFVPDRNDPYKYHPRIGVQHDYIYRSLNDWEKAAFNRLYDQYYYHRHNEFWREQAMNKLPQLTQSTRMLVCGEDLGMIPGCVAWVMNDLRILSLEIQRMPKDPTQEFGHRTGIRIALFAPYPHTICPPCAAGGKKTSSKHNVTTTRCSDITAPLLPLPRPNFAKRLYASTCTAIPSLHTLPTGLDVDGRQMAQPQCAGRTHQCTRQSAPLLALAYAPDAGTTDESRKSERKDKRTYRTNGTINSILTDNE